MPVNFAIPTPRAYSIGTVNGVAVQPNRDWLNYWTRDLPALFGGPGMVNTLPEVKQAADNAQAAADAAKETADSAVVSAAVAQEAADNAQAAAGNAQDAADDAQAAADTAQADIDALEAELLAVYETRVDVVAGPPEIIYVGTAVPGSVDSDPVWRVVRYTVQTDGDVSSEYADGDADFDNVWNDHLTLTY